MFFVNGKLLRTNIDLLDNPFEYYRLIGEAYNSHVLDRALVEATPPRLSQSKGQKHGSTPYITYVIDGIP